MLNDRRPKVVTPAEKLRETLSELERQLGKLDYSTKGEILDIPFLFDKAAVLVEDFKQHEVAIAPELARFSAVSGKFRNKAAVFLKKIGGAEELARLRSDGLSDSEHWWWFVDEYLAAERQTRTRRTLKGMGIGLGVLAVLAVLYMLFLAPDKVTRERFKYQQSAERLAQEGDYAGALAEVERALEIAPEEAELYVLKGVLQQALAQPTEAEASFAKAEALLNDRIAFLEQRAQTYLLLMMPERTLADAEEILSIDPVSVQGYFFKGKAHDVMNNFWEASEAYQTTAELAAAAGQTELEAMARIQDAQLMQRMMVAPQQQATATPEEGE